MSLQYPRYMKNLGNVETGSVEDYNTPCTQKAFINNKSESNKENIEFKAGDNSEVRKNSFSLNTTTNSKPFFRPKRLSELPTLDSDSEEEDSITKDNLNCAILNDSFIHTPSKSEQDESYTVKEKSDEPLLNNLGSLNLDRKDEIKTAKSISVNEEELETPLKIVNTNQIMGNKSKVKDVEFVTPQIHHFSVKRRPKDLCSTHTQKTHSSLVNEFRSQKVLFQTPMSLTRPPISCLPNDSMSLLLFDSISEDNAPSTNEKLSQINDKQLNQNPSSYKKSLAAAFAQADTEVIEKTHDDKHNDVKMKAKETTIQIKNINYIILQKLGCGGSSAVYAAKCLNNDKEYAIKIVDLQGEPAIIEGYVNEIKLLAKLQGNSCVVSLIDYQLLQRESKLIIVMEKGDSDLSKVLQNYNTDLPLYVLVNFLYQMLQAVDYIHQNGVIHSDLKPANFLMINGRLKLIDFGIASNIAVDSTSIIKYSQTGTFNYISPEVLTDISTGNSPLRLKQPKIKISTKSDVWSLGCILYLFLYKKTPFSHIKNLNAKMSAISNPRNVIDYGPLPSYYPPMLVHMVKNCLQYNPKERPSCAELLQYPFHMIIPIQNLMVSRK